MKHETHHQASSMNQALTTVPVIRLDSGAVRIPVKMLENISPTRGNQKTLRVTITKTTFCAWREL